MPRPKTGLHFYWILESLFKVKKNFNLFKYLYWVEVFGIYE